MKSFLKLSKSKAGKGFSLLAFSLLFILYLLIPLNTIYSSIVFYLISPIFYYSIYRFVSQRLNYLVVTAFVVVPFFSSLLFGAGSLFSYKLHPLALVNDRLEYKVLYVMASLYMPLILLLVSSFLPKKYFGKRSFVSFDLAYNRNVRTFFWVMNTFFALYLVFNIRDVALLGYLTRVVIGAGLWYVFLVGFLNSKAGIHFWITFALLTSNAFFEIFAGGRNAAIFPFLILGAGYLLSLNMQKRKMLVLFTLLTFPILRASMGIIGYIREDIGRGDISSVDGQRVEQFSKVFSNALNRYLNDASFEESIDGEASSRLSGGGALQRVIALTPERIPFRGFTSFFDEVKAAFDIVGFRSAAVDEIREVRADRFRQGLGKGAANRYGFHVTATHSVEWPVFADGFSRGGILVVFLYGLSIVTFFSFLFYKAEAWFGTKIGRLLFYTMLIQISFGGLSAMPYVDFIRSLILNVMVFVVIIKATELIFIRLKQKRNKYQAYR